MEHSTIAILIVGIAIVSFMIEKIPLAVTAMAASLAMGITGVMPFSAVSSGFAASVTMMVAGMMIIGDALFETGVAKVIGLKVGRSKLARNERTFLIIVVGIATLLTGFLSNSAVIAMFMPIIAAVASKSNGRIKAKNITIFAGMGCAVGGSLTIVGSTAQLVAQGILIKTEGARAIGFFEMAPACGALCIIFLIYAATFGLNTARKSFDFEDPPVPESDAGDSLDEDVKVTWQMILASGVGVFCLVGFVIGLWNVGIIALFGATILMATKAIDYRKSLRNLDWNTLIILGAAQGFAYGLDVSGGGRVIADVVLSVFGGVDASAYVLLIVAIVLSTVLTNFMSNTALVAMLVPIFLPICFALNVDPIIFTIAIVISSNTAIATPIGTPCVTQTLPAGYRWMDYVRVGLPINLITMVVMIFIMPLLYSW